MKTFVLFALIAFVVFLSGCTSITDLFMGPPSSQEPTTLEACQEQPLGSRDSCIRTLVDSGQSTSLCSNISNELLAGECFASIYNKESNKNPCIELTPGSVADYCYIQTAKLSKDPTICINITDNASQSSCVNLFLNEIKTISLCELLPTDAELISCLSSLAFESESVEPCQQIEDVDLMNECFESIDETNEYYCGFISGLNAKDSCYANNAVNNKNSDICKKIGIIETRDSCYQDVALKTAGAKHCGFISTTEKKDECLDKISKLKGGLQKCVVLDDKTARDQCYYDLAADVLNPQYCAYMSFSTTNFELKNDCYDNVAQGINDFELCSKIYEDDNKTNNCIAQIGINLQDQSICTYIEPWEKTNLDTCYKGIAELRLEKSICYKINDSNNYSKCIRNIAIDTNNEVLCLDARSYKIRDQCIDDIARNKNSPGICELIKTTLSTRDNCFTHFALRPGEESLEFCDKIGFPEKKGQCYEEFGLATGNINICTQVEVGRLTQLKSYEARDNCYKFLAEDTGDKDYCVKIKLDEIQSDCNAFFP